MCVCVRAGTVPDGEVETKLSVTLPDSTWQFPEVGGGLQIHSCLQAFFSFFFSLSPRKFLFTYGFLFYFCFGNMEMNHVELL